MSDCPKDPTPREIVIDAGCYECPMRAHAQGKDYCGHPDARDADIGLALDPDAVGIPEACPLRTAPALVRLTSEGHKS